MHRIKSFFFLFLALLLLTSSTIVSSGLVKAAQTSSNISGLITSDTTWTKANSPYTLEGPTGVTEGVTLTIEPGVTVNFVSYNIEVNGTVRAQGSSNNKIFFTSDASKGQLNTPRIRFMSKSTSWNEQTSSGCIIENAIFDSVGVSMSEASPKISNNNFGGGYFGNSAVAVNYGSTPIISNNIIDGTGSEGSHWVRGIFCGDNALILDNIVSNWRGSGIAIGGGSPIIEGNLIVNNTGSPVNGFAGIRIDWAQSTPIIRNNTIAQNRIGINLLNGPSLVLVNNNIYDNTEYNVYLMTNNMIGNPQHDLDFTQNWWGTTDVSAINQTIWDSKKDYNLGTVNFVPILSEPNPDAPDATPSSDFPPQSNTETQQETEPEADNGLDVDVGIDVDVDVEPEPSLDATEVCGILNVDTTWTKENSPYVVTMPLLVNTSATLVIDPGVQVYLNNKYIRVAGTLRARGTIEDPIWLICLGNAKIQFFDSSTDWDGQTGSGSIIENAFIPSWESATCNIYVEMSSPKISNCTVTNVGTARTISLYDSGSTVSNCTIIGGNNGIEVNSPSICSEVAHIVGNVISNCRNGIVLSGCSPIVEWNLIVNSEGEPAYDQGGIRIYRSSAIIRNNTIAQTGTGFHISGYNNSPTVVFNNIVDVEQRVYMWVGATSDIDVTNNWWGTTDVSAINQTIRDFKNDFGLGKVSYVPLLAEPNTNAPAVSGLFEPISESDIDPLQYSEYDVDVDVGVDVDVSDSEVDVIVDVDVTVDSDSHRKATRLSIGLDDVSEDGSVVNVKGKLTDLNGNPVANKSVTVSYSIADNNWALIGSETTDNNGDYSLQWDTQGSETFALIAEWNGDTKYLGTSATLALGLLSDQNQPLFYIESNSTVTALEFDGINPRLSFTVSGPDGTTGYITVTVPKNLLQTEEDWTVFVDGNPVTPTITEDATKTYLHFTYSHSTHTIEIVGKTTALPEYLVLLALILFTVGATTLVIYFKRHKSKKDLH